MMIVRTPLATEALSRLRQAVHLKNTYAEGPNEVNAAGARLILRTMRAAFLDAVEAGTEVEALEILEDYDG